VVILGERNTAFKEDIPFYLIPTKEKKRKKLNS
jgi:hypothetical protein